MDYYHDNYHHESAPDRLRSEGFDTVQSLDGEEFSLEEVFGPSQEPGDALWDPYTRHEDVGP